MRGGTSRGPYLLASDLPLDPERRDAVLLAVMGSPNPMQVDGLGGGRPQTSKVAIVSSSVHPGCDVDYLFAQVEVAERRVDTRPNCGNMLAGVGPFAIESGLVKAAGETTVVRIFNVNTGAVIEATIQTPGGEVSYFGDAAIAGVPGTSAPIPLMFRNFVGAKTGKLLPTGKPRETIDGIDVSLVDSAMPMMLLDGRRLGFAGLEAVLAAAQGSDVFGRTEPLRIEAGHRMGLGDVRQSVIPKVGLLFPTNEATIAIAYLTPWALHGSLAVTGGICVATACWTPGTIAAELAGDPVVDIVIGHPSGIMELSVQPGNGSLTGAGTVRTARKIFEGKVFVPESLFGEH